MKTYLNAMMNNTNVFLLWFLIPSWCCIAQTADKNEICNRNAVDKSIARLLQEGICIPEGHTAEKVIKDFDFNGDGKFDVAVRYARYPLEDGSMRYDAIFEQVSDTIFNLKKELRSLAVPFIEVLSASYRESHPKADSLVKIYPITRKIIFSADSLFIKHKIPDDFGKTYLFIYDKIKDNWYLQNIRYWFGELPLWLVRNADLREELLYGRIYLEEKIPDKQISIDEFDLIESKRIADIEENPYLMNKYDVFELGAKKQK